MLNPTAAVLAGNGCENSKLYTEQLSDLYLYICVCTLKYKNKWDASTQFQRLE